MDDVERPGAVLCFADHFDVGLGVQQHAEAGPYEGLVVGQDDSDHEGTSARVGSTARTRNPPPGRAAAESVPPSPAARSRMPARPWPGLVLSTVEPRPSSATSTSSAAA